MQDWVFKLGSYAVFLAHFFTTYCNLLANFDQKIAEMKELTQKLQKSNSYIFIFFWPLLCTYHNKNMGKILKDCSHAGKGSFLVHFRSFLFHFCFIFGSLLVAFLKKYRKFANSSTSCLVASLNNFRLFMKGKFKNYLLWPFAEKYVDLK